MTFELHHGDARTQLEQMDDQSVHTCITSPPYYGLRDYGESGQIGVEDTPEEYVERLVKVFRCVRRVLRDDGTLWLNLGDSYSGTGKSGGCSQGDRWDNYGKKTVGPKGGAWSPPPRGMKQKDLMGIPWMVAFSLRQNGWYLRQDIIWHKPNPMPESVKDRCTKAHEYIFLLSKSERYFYDYETVKEPAKKGASGSTFYTGKTAGHQLGRSSSRQRADSDTRNRRSVWTVSTKPYKGAHFATFPPELIKPCVLAGAPGGGTVLDPFCGSGTTGAVAIEHGRKFVGIDLSDEYLDLARRRIGEMLERQGRIDGESAEELGVRQLGIFAAGGIE